MKFRLIFLLGLLWYATAALAQDSASAATTFYRGVDLSYVNEMQDCGAVYQVDGQPRDPYQIFHDAGANLVRLRLWNDPTWTNYSTLDDVIRSAQRAKALGMGVLLDFHFSDAWADPGHQTIPAAWANITDQAALGQALYQYTFDVLAKLDSLGLMPEIVQVGNEINTEILRPADAPGYPIHWPRNAFLLNQAIRAVRDAGAKSAQTPRVMLHIAKPESVEGWLSAAEQAGVTDYDIIGISYYPGWSTHTLQTVGGVIQKLRYEFGKDVLIAETAYPWTFDAVAESANNILNSSNLLAGYAATPDGQRRFLIDLEQTVLSSGGLGIVYWEPGWVSTPCHTLWGQGSHWENATFFDFQHGDDLLPAADFLHDAYEYPVDVTLSFRLENGDSPEQIYLWGDFTGMGRRLLTLPLSDGAYRLHTLMMPGTVLRYQFYTSPPAARENALLPQSCLGSDGYATLAVPDHAVTVRQTDVRCSE